MRRQHPGVLVAHRPQQVVQRRVGPVVQVRGQQQRGQPAAALEVGALVRQPVTAVGEAPPQGERQLGSRRRTGTLRLLVDLTDQTGQHRSFTSNGVT
ncbi:hypothetical protein [Nonomuraea salmonea]|uniref:hypothetical protein n=1 Tax=Nonomuraea salmonea TaxID=46181 RepID=UPI0031E6ADB3